MKVIFHPGFHKTGTSTLQAALRENQNRLWPGIRIIQKEDMPGLTGAAKGYSVSLKPVDLALVIYEATQVAERITPDTDTVIITSESLCGQIPGRDNVQDYGAAPRLLSTISAAFDAVHPTAEQSFFFSTRAPEAWLKSCHAQHLRASRMRMTADAYIETYASSAQLDAILNAIKSALPSRKVTAVPVEDTGTSRLGMLDHLLDLTTLQPDQRAMLSPAAWANRAPPPEQLDAFLRINLSDLSDHDARAARLKLNGEIG